MSRLDVMRVPPFSMAQTGQICSSDCLNARDIWAFVGLPLAGRPFVSAARLLGPDTRSGPTI